MVKIIGVNARGYRIGQWNQFARFSDRVVEQIRQLRDDGMTYPAIAEKMEMSKWTVADICRHRRRAEVPARFKRVDDSPKEATVRVVAIHPASQESAEKKSEHRAPLISGREIREMYGFNAGQFCAFLSKEGAPKTRLHHASYDVSNNWYSRAEVFFHAESLGISKVEA